MDHGMGDMPGMMPTTPSNPPGMSNGMVHPRHGMMHMTFYWGSEGMILFSGWPGHRVGMYVLALILVFLASLLVEVISHLRIFKSNPGTVFGGLVQTVVYVFRVGLSYLVMLALMSFNGGVFLAAVAGHALGYLLFGSGLFFRGSLAGDDKPSNLASMKC